MCYYFCCTYPCLVVALKMMVCSNWMIGSVKKAMVSVDKLVVTCQQEVYLMDYTLGKIVITS